MEESQKTPDELTPMSEEMGQAGETSPQPAPETATPGELVQEPEEKVKIKLSEPSGELAKKLLSEVRFEDHLIGVRDNPSAGEERENIYSFEEAVTFLRLNDDDFWGCDWTFSIDQKDLQKWVGEILGDKELARVIEDKIKECANYTGYDRCLKEIEQLKDIKGLMECRLKQCKELITGETGA